MTTTATKPRKPSPPPVAARPQLLHIQGPAEPSPVVNLLLALIEPHPHNPGRSRCTPESIAELAASLARDGQQQPILVRPHGEGRFQVIFGERRYRAAKAAHRNHIEARVATIDDREALRLMAVENGQRVDLDPIAIAEHLRQLTQEQPDGGQAYTQAEAGELYSIKQAEVSNRIRLLRLPERWLDLAHKAFDRDHSAEGDLWRKNQWQSGSVREHLEHLVHQHLAPVVTSAADRKNHPFWAENVPILSAQDRERLEPFELKLGERRGLVTFNTALAEELRLEHHAERGRQRRGDDDDPIQRAGAERDKRAQRKHQLVELHRQTRERLARVALAASIERQPASALSMGWGLAALQICRGGHHEDAAHILEVAAAGLAPRPFKVGARDLPRLLESICESGAVDHFLSIQAEALRIALWPSVPKGGPAAAAAKSLHASWIRTEPVRRADRLATCSPLVPILCELWGVQASDGWRMAVHEDEAARCVVEDWLGQLRRAELAPLAKLFGCAELPERAGEAKAALLAAVGAGTPCPKELARC